FEYSDLLTEVLYSLLMIIRCSAVGVMILSLIECEEGDRTAEHLWQLLRSRQTHLQWMVGKLKLLLSGRLRGIACAWSLMSLLAFQEFETAALMQIDRWPVAWTVWLFDAHAARYPLAQSLILLCKAILVQILLMAPAAVVFYQAHRSRRSVMTGLHQTSISSGSPPASRAARPVMIGWLAIAVLFFVLLPVITSVRPLVGGADLVTRQSFLRQSGQQIAVSTGFAVAAAIVSLWIAVTTLNFTRSYRRTILLAMLPLPGLCGPLFVSLSGLALFQQPVFRPLYDTWLPLLSGLTIAVLPRALLVAVLLQHLQHPAATYSAELLLAHRHGDVRSYGASILWRLVHLRWIGAAALLAHWCVWDVTTTSILRPVALEPVVTRLYDEMHYGYVDALVWLSVVAALSIPVVALLAAVVSRGILHWRARQRL
ncbi:MAG: hypothetical protein KDA85_08335, partial [Planctomycetaceae bacterium]|nr:hypothetical protein [Planctomycetaceae bacterium]